MILKLPCSFCQNKTNLISGFIILLSVVFGTYLRFYRINDIPIEIFSDEAMTFASAKSVIETGKDLFNQNIIYFSDRLEMRPPVYGYLAYFSSKIWGESTFGLRFPAALMGSFNILTVGLIGFLMTNKIGIFAISSFIYAFIPWSIHFSKSGYEPPAFLFFFLGSLMLHLLGIIKKKKWAYFLSAFIWGICIYTYSSVLFWLYLFLPVLFIIQRRLVAHFYTKKDIFIFCITILLFSLPYYYLIATQPLMLTRPKNISTFTNGYNPKSINIFIKNYFSHFSSDFLFFKGDTNLRHGIGIGELFPVLAPCLLIGMRYILMHLKTQPIFFILLTGFITFPLGGSLTNDGVPHATRTLLGSLWLTIISALGIWHIGARLLINKGLKYFSLLIIPICICISIYLTSFLTKKYDQYQIQSATWWEYGNHQVFTKIKPWVSNTPIFCLGNLNYWNSQALIAYYMPYDKAKMLETLDDPRCLIKNAIKVIPAYQNYDQSQQLIDTVYNLDHSALYKIVRNKN